MKEIHKRAVEMWLFAKQNDNSTPKANPSIIVIEHLTGQIINLDNEPQNTVQVCQKINEIKGLGDLSEEDKIEITKYGIQLYHNSKGSKTQVFIKALWLPLLNWIGYILGSISIGIGGFSWWIVGLGIGTWWAYGAAKIAANRLNYEPRPSWEISAHMFTHIVIVLGLIGFSIYNLIK